MSSPIKNALRFYIAKERISLKELSERLDICYSYMQQIISGKRKGSSYLKDRIALLIRASEKLTSDEKKTLETLIYKNMPKLKKSNV